jgi:plasmid stabilization system protein ParE
MAQRVVWSARAIADLEGIASYISSDSPAYARSVVKKIVSATRNLAPFPNSGRIVPEFQDEKIREVLAFSYRVIDEVKENSVLIAAIIHGKRNLT